MDVELELNELKDRLSRLEMTVHQIVEQEQKITTSLQKSPQPEIVLVWLKNQGLVSDLPPEAKSRVERWQNTPAEEQQAHIRSMRQLRLDKSLGDIVQENRR